MDEKTEALQNLLSEISAGLADISEAFATRQTSADEMASSLADIATTIEGYKVLPLGELIAAVKALRITPAVNVTNQIAVPPSVVNITVPPADIRFMPAPESTGATWEVRIPSHFNGPDRVMTIRRTT